MNSGYYPCDEASLLKKDMINISFESVWHGNGEIKLTGNLIKSLNLLDKELTKTNNFFNASSLLDKYINNDKEISSLSFRLRMLPNTSKNASTRASLQSSIDALVQENRGLRNQIESILSTITPVGTSSDNVNFTLSDDTSDKLNELILRFNSGLTKLNTGDSLAFYYDQRDENGNLIKGSGLEGINNMVELVRNSYSGREAVVNSCLLIFQLASDKGLKLQYRAAGTNPKECYVPVRALLSGIDCNPYASWAIDKGTPGGFMWRPVSMFPTVAPKIPYDNWDRAQPGDVISNGGHVAIIIENDPINHRFITAEARGSRIGIVLASRDYVAAARDYNVVCDMTDVYNGKINTDRKEAFPLIFGNQE